MDDYSSLSNEELIELISETESKLTSVSLERDSLKEENDKLIGDMASVKDELQNVKKLNYTLARQIDRKPQNEDFDSILINLFGNARKD